MDGGAKVGTTQLQARPDLVGSFGMCASTHWTASATAQSVLERGGNAFDAATAAAFVLHIVEPHLNGPGGDLVALLGPVGSPVRVLAGQGPAPRAATIAHFRSEGLAMVPGSGTLAATVPGAVEAWLLLLRDYGSWRLGDVLEYAIGYAAHGHPILSKAAGVIDAVTGLFREHWPSSAQQWLSTDGIPPSPGDLVRNVAYAETLRRLVAAGAYHDRVSQIDAARRAWSEGFVAHAVAAFVVESKHHHSTGTDHYGVLSLRDMRMFRASYETPVCTTFRDTTVVKAGPWTQGPVLLQALSILSGYNDHELDLEAVAGVHRVVEALKLAMADRDAYYGERTTAAHLTTLLSDSYAAARRKLITERASDAIRPGSIGTISHIPRLTLGDSSSQSPTAGEPTVTVGGYTRGDTCHIDVVDRWGNMISATPSGGWLQSSPTIPDLGFCLGTRLQMAWLDESSPSALRPGERPRTTLSPTLLMRGDDVVSALGTPGGDQQDQWQLLYLIRILTSRQTPQQAIEAPTFHTTSFPASFWPRAWTPAGLVTEDRIGDRMIEELIDRGHQVTRAGDWTLGRLSSVTRDPSSGLLSAAANPRGAQGYAAGR